MDQGAIQLLGSDLLVCGGEAGDPPWVMCWVRIVFRKLEPHFERYALSSLTDGETRVPTGSAGRPPSAVLSPSAVTSAALVLTLLSRGAGR